MSKKSSQVAQLASCNIAGGAPLSFKDYRALNYFLSLIMPSSILRVWDMIAKNTWNQSKDLQLTIFDSLPLRKKNMSQ